MKKTLLTVLATVVATSAVAGTTQFGDWKYVDDIDPVSNASTPHIYTKSVEGKSRYGDSAIEGVGCSSIYINTPGVVIDQNYSSHTTPIQTRFGSESKPSVGHWTPYNASGGAAINLPTYEGWAGNRSVWTNQSIFNQLFQRQVDESVKDNPHHWVKVPAYGQAAVNYKFSDKGFNDAINKLAGACSSRNTH